MIRSLLYLTARDGNRDAIVELYRREEILETAVRQDGCLGAELQVPRGPEGDLLVTALWRDAAAYDAWVASPLRERTAPALAELVEGEVGRSLRGELYEVVVAVGASVPS